MVSRETLERALAALQRIQEPEPPAPAAPIRLVPDVTPLPRRTPARIPGQRRGEAR
ncbi:hypothetical protein LI90_2926 [Carbonactinospora thermoautotrophica]|uniref:Uncharacterized protein n=1 Tax=Carbonactinospora thermoautotrophica TaxID=1469144 RepID=A0A132MVM9_9ACTN|nr:hypothetical protein [Carbonactinospora thermoautotrophica]KWX01893.1 hypothetical protein LI90_2926 [Carbonactinospora thermoautotrophica]